MKKFKIVLKEYRFIIYYLMNEARNKGEHYKIVTTINNIEVEQKITYATGFCFCFNNISQAFGIQSYHERKKAYKYPAFRWRSRCATGGEYDNRNQEHK